MEIRLLTADDASAYWDFRLEALEREVEAFSTSAEEHRALSLQDVKSRLGPDPSNFFVVGAFEGNRLVGTAGFYREKGPKTRHKGRIWGVYVTRQARGKGVGRALMRALLQRASTIGGIEQIQLSVTTTQAAAAALYRSLGFESFGLEPQALRIGDRYVDEEYMVLFMRRPEGSLKRESNGEGQKKKRPRLFSLGRLGSPPPELPNHVFDSKIGLILCKRHFGNGNLPRVMRFGD